MFCGSLRLFRAKKMCFDRKAWHETSAAWICMCRWLWDRQAGTFGRSTKVTLKTSPGMLVSSIHASPASKEEFNYILYNKDYQNAGNHLFSKILLPLTLHNHASCLPNRSKWPGHPPLVPELCSPCLNFPAMHFWWIQGTGPLCFMTVANIILSAVIILHGKGIHGSSISGLSVAYLHLLVKCLMLNLSIGHLKFCSIQKSECPKAAG